MSDTRSAAMSLLAGTDLTEGDRPLTPEEARDLAEEMLMVREAAVDLYMAGRWTLAAPASNKPPLRPSQQALLWAKLRDALGLAEGTATEVEAGAEAKHVHEWFGDPDLSEPGARQYCACGAERHKG